MEWGYEGFKSGLQERRVVQGFERWKRCVQGHQCICAKGNVFYGKLTPVKLNIYSEGNSSI